jgi:hypothetical protein
MRVHVALRKQLYSLVFLSVVLLVQGVDYAEKYALSGSPNRIVQVNMRLLNPNYALNVVLVLETVLLKQL